MEDAPGFAFWGGEIGPKGVTPIERALSCPALLGASLVADRPLREGQEWKLPYAVA